MTFSATYVNEVFVVGRAASGAFTIERRGGGDGVECANGCDWRELKERLGGVEPKVVHPACDCSHANDLRRAFYDLCLGGASGAHDVDLRRVSCGAARFEKALRYEEDLALASKLAREKRIREAVNGGVAAPSPSPTVDDAFKRETADAIAKRREQIDNVDRCGGQAIRELSQVQSGDDARMRERHKDLEGRVVAIEQKLEAASQRLDALADFEARTNDDLNILEKTTVRVCRACDEEGAVDRAGLCADCAATPETKPAHATCDDCGADCLVSDLAAGICSACDDKRLAAVPMLCVDCETRPGEDWHPGSRGSLPPLCGPCMKARTAAGDPYAAPPRPLLRRFGEATIGRAVRAAGRARRLLNEPAWAICVAAPFCTWGACCAIDVAPRLLDLVIAFGWWPR